MSCDPAPTARFRHLLFLLTTGVALTLLVGCKKENAYVPPPPPQVGVAHPLARNVTPYLEATGNTAAYNQVDLEARIEGFVQEIDYTDGAFVKAGTTLFVIEPAPYQAKLQQAQAELDAANAGLIESGPEFQRQATLLQQNVTAQNTYDQAKAKYDSDKANVLNQTAGVALAGINFGYTHVTAPFDGIVTAHLVSVGALVGVSGPTKLATIVQQAPIYVDFNVSEQQVLQVRANLAKAGINPAEMRANINKVPVEIGLMTESGYPHKGRLDYSAPTVDSSTGTLAVRAIFENANRDLLPGYFVRIRIPLHYMAGPALLVPDIALGTSQAGRYLLVVNKDNVVEQRTVQTGQLEGALRVITEGIKPDDEVVITGLTRAIPGAKVSPQPATMPES
jgi:membrane fusion protein, multidrug efflux system